MKSLWTHLDNYFSDDVRLPTLTSQTVLFVIFNDSSFDENVSLINHILLIFKLHVYKSRKKTFTKSAQYHWQYTHNYDT